MIRGEPRQAPTASESGHELRRVSPDVVWDSWNIPRAEREKAAGHSAAVIWFTGISGSGKTTIARAVERRLFDAGVQTMLLDGDQLRHGINGDLGFSPSDREENIRRAGEVARLFFEQGSVVLCSFVSPYARARERVRSLFPTGAFFEIHVDCDLETARRRDPKGLYEKAARGAIPQMTGMSSPYEVPEKPDLRIDSITMVPEQATASILEMLRERRILPSKGSGD